MTHSAATPAKTPRYFLTIPPSNVVPSCQYPAPSKKGTDPGYWLLGTGYCSPENRIVMKLDVPACSPLRRIDHAGIKGPRIHVQRDRALVRFPRIHHPVHRLPRIDGARVGHR